MPLAWAAFLGSLSGDSCPGIETEHSRWNTSNDLDPRARLAAADPGAAAILKREERRQHQGLTLIALENHAFPELRPLLGSVFADKYAEGQMRRLGSRERTQQR